MTQGDTFLIAFLSSKRTQGVYALASNYGGLVARLILQPIEESSRNYFGKLLASKETKPSKEDVEKASENLGAILRVYSIFSIIIAAGGPVLAPILLKIVVGARWEGTGVEDVLGAYCYYIPLLAFNGLTEAFVSSVATKAEINRQSAWMLTFSAGFGGAAYYFLGVLNLGAKGVVYANVINMAFRIIWSLSFIKGYFRRNGTEFKFITFRPEPMSFASGLAIFLLLSRFEVFTTEEPLDQIFKGGLLILAAIIMS